MSPPEPLFRKPTTYGTSYTMKWRGIYGYRRGYGGGDSSGIGYDDGDGFGHWEARDTQSPVWRLDARHF